MQLAGSHLMIPRQGTFFEKGELMRVKNRGTFWHGDFTHFQTPGNYQIETDFQISASFQISDGIYDRIALGFLTFLRAQRCGCDVYGVHPAFHCDDGVLDSDGGAWPVTGGWHEAGDFRKWLAFTQYHLDALVKLMEKKIRKFRARAGRTVMPCLMRSLGRIGFFHGMITRPVKPISALLRVWELRDRMSAGRKKFLQTARDEVTRFVEANFSQCSWHHHAERLLQRSLGHNTVNRSQFTEIGFRQPVGY